MFVDEVQDLNQAQLELIKRVVAPEGGRIIMFGDDQQSICTFRGAHTTSPLEEELAKCISK